MPDPLRPRKNTTSDASLPSTHSTCCTDTAASAVPRMTYS